ncbi:MAG: DUF4416 family protein [Planctomycetia bacterium]|nr:DUF4416 family protein [Planctomycetia bacterium]
MGEIKKIPAVLLIIAAFSHSRALLAEAKERATAHFGPLYKESPEFSVDEFTHYYEKEMGLDLIKQLWCFENLVDPGELASIKVMTNSWESDFPAESGAQRPVNLDPGYIDLGKLILASTKDHAHRIYLQQGIFAETTLMYRHKQWQSLAWTYPDYQSPGYLAFLTDCREYLHRKRVLAMNESP